MDSKKAISKAFADLAPRYERVMDQELRKIWGWTYQEFVDRLISLTSIDDNDLILDVATGTGVIPIRLNKDFTKKFKVIGLDLTYRMLENANGFVETAGFKQNIKFTCASAMDIPFSSECFDRITCGLATHHMSIPKLLKEMQRILKNGGRITIVDVGASPIWKLPVVNSLIRIIAFFLFFPSEGWNRAWAESTAVSNMYTPDEWENALAKAGFSEIKVSIMKSRKFWSPSPISLTASKNGQNGGLVDVISN